MSTTSIDLDTLAANLERRAVDLGAMLDQLRWAVARALSADRATMYLVDPVRQELVSRSADLPGDQQIRLSIGEGLAGEVARSGRPARLGRADPLTDAARRVEAETGYRTRSMLGVPLVRLGRTVGVLQVLNKRGGDFTEDDQQRLVGLAERLVAVLLRTSLAATLDSVVRQPVAFQFNHVVGDAASMRSVFELVSRAARSDITVLFTGPSGSGKTLLARALHDNSRRADGPFVVVDCAAIPETLVENELFGHEAGAYTGADKPADGKVAAADGGTLFLDEVGDLSLPAQRKLLRLLQERTYFPVGGVRPRTANVRFVCATNRDLPADVARGSFRQDLLYRLRVVELRLPTLAERGAEDLDRLIDHYVFELSRLHDRPDVELSPQARRRLHAHPWPGNVRELRNVLEAAVVLARTPRIGPEDIRLPDEAVRSDTSAAFSVGEPTPLREVSARYVQWALDRCEGNRSEAARRLGIGRGTLADWLDRPKGGASERAAE